MTSTTLSITVEAFLPHPIERVWRALTDPAKIVQWLGMENDLQPTAGHRFTFQTSPMPAFGFDGIVHCEVTEADPPHYLAYSWVGGPLDTLVRFRLEAAEQNGVRGTRLRFEHSGFDPNKPLNQNAYDGMSGGWRSIGHRLNAVLDELAAAGG